MTVLATKKDAAEPPIATAEHARLIVVARGDARFCFGLGDVSEVGKIVQLARMDGPHEAFLGSMVLHGWCVPVVDIAAAIGAVPEKADEPRMFVATQTEPVVCIVVDEILGLRERGPGGACEGSHELVRELATMDGQSLPIIDVSAVAKLAGGAASPTAERDSDQAQDT